MHSSAWPILCIFTHFCSVATSYAPFQTCNGLFDITWRLPLCADAFLRIGALDLSARRYALRRVAAVVHVRDDRRGLRVRRQRRRRVEHAPDRDARGGQQRYRGDFRRLTPVLRAFALFPLFSSVNPPKQEACCSAPFPLVFIRNAPSGKAAALCLFRAPSHPVFTRRPFQKGQSGVFRPDAQLPAISLMVMSRPPTGVRLRPKHSGHSSS